MTRRTRGHCTQLSLAAVARSAPELAVLGVRESECLLAADFCDRCLDFNVAREGFQLTAGVTDRAALQVRRRMVTAIAIERAKDPEFALTVILFMTKLAGDGLVRLVIERGRMHVPNRPGLGFSLSEQARQWTRERVEFGHRA